VFIGQSVAARRGPRANDDGVETANGGYRRRPGIQALTAVHKHHQTTDEV